MSLICQCFIGNCVLQCLRKCIIFLRLYRMIKYFFSFSLLLKLSCGGFNIECIFSYGTLFVFIYGFITISQVTEIVINAAYNVAWFNVSRKNRVWRKKYRTKNYNKVLDFIYQQTNELYESKTKSGDSFSTFSASVARPGIEPGTSWLWIMRSNQLSYLAIAFCGAKIGL